MTPDEFHGHLMTALHGPKAEEVVARIVEIVVETSAETIANTVLNVVGVATNEMEDQVFNLAVIALTDGATVSAASNAYAATQVARENLRESIAKYGADHPDLMKTLGVKTP